MTSKKRLRGRLRPEGPKKKLLQTGPPPPLSKGLDDGPPPHVSQGLDPALIENVGQQIHMANQKGKQSSKGGPMVRTLASHKCSIRIPKSRQLCGLKLLLVLTFTPREYGRFFFSLLKHHDFQIHREWQTMEILECKAGVKGRTLHVTNKNANERGQEIFLIVIEFVTCEVR